VLFFKIDCGLQCGFGSENLVFVSLLLTDPPRPLVIGLIDT